jgi:Domain of unknown function (DUF4160)
LRSADISPTAWEDWQTQFNPAGYGIEEAKQVIIFHRWGNAENGAFERFEPPKRRRQSTVSSSNSSRPNPRAGKTCIAARTMASHGATQHEVRRCLHFCHLAISATRRKVLIAMPTVLRVGPYRFFFYAGDGAEPPHVHVERDDKTGKFWLRPVRLQDSGGFTRVEITRLQAIVDENLETLLRSWDAFFEH